MKWKSLRVLMLVFLVCMVFIPLTLSLSIKKEFYPEDGRVVIQINDVKQKITVIDFVPFCLAVKDVGNGTLKHTREGIKYLEWEVNEPTVLIYYVVKVIECDKKMRLSPSRAILPNNSMVFSNSVQLKPEDVDKIPSNRCNSNNLCEPPRENYKTCPQDCPSGSKDGYCDAVPDGKCDPDCLHNEDIDCLKEKQKGNKWIVWIVLGGVIVAIGLIFMFFFRRMKRTSGLEYAQ